MTHSYINDAPFKKRGKIVELHGNVRDYQIHYDEILKFVQIASELHFKEKYHVIEDVKYLVFKDIGKYKLSSNAPIAFNSVIDIEENEIISQQHKLMHGSISFSGKELGIGSILSTQGVSHEILNPEFHISKIDIDENHKGFKKISYLVKNLDDNITNLSPVSTFFRDAHMPKDPQLFNQWYLEKSNLVPTLNSHTGKGVKVAVLDSGYSPLHDDLEIDQDNFVMKYGIMSPHSLNVAGIIGAKRNDKNIAGIAPDAKLTNLQLPFLNYQDETIDYTIMKNFDVVNNSWGKTFIDHAFLERLDEDEMDNFHDAMAEVVQKGRSGLGTNVVFASGNAGIYGADANQDVFNNLREVITVGGIIKQDEDFFGNEKPIYDFPTPGENVLISAPASHILTLDVKENEITPQNHIKYDQTTSYVHGTSFAAPIVTSVIALMLEENAALGWRDVQEILAFSANTPSSVEEPNLDQLTYNEKSHIYRINAANKINGQGFQFSKKFGFGEVDGEKAVKLAKYWPLIQTSSALEKTSFLIPKLNHTFLSKDPLEISFNMQKNSEIEYVSVNVDLFSYNNHSLSIASPSGSVSKIYDMTNDHFIGRHFRENTESWKFGSHFFKGESSQGEWKIVLELFSEDPNQKPVGALLSDISFDLKSNHFPHQHIFTNKIAQQKDLHEASLKDNQMLNLAILDTPHNIDLSGAKESYFSGNEVKITNAEDIKHVIVNDQHGDIKSLMQPIEYQIYGGDHIISLSGVGNVIYFNTIDENIGNVILQNFNPLKSDIQFFDDTDPGALEEFLFYEDGVSKFYEGENWSLQLIGETEPTKPPILEEHMCVCG